MYLGLLEAHFATFLDPFLAFGRLFGRLLASLNQSQACLEHTSSFRRVLWVYLGRVEAHFATTLEPILALLTPLSGLWICLSAQFGIHLDECHLEKGAP